MYKPPKLVTEKPSKYKPPGGLYLENCPQIQSKTKQSYKASPIDL